MGRFHNRASKSVATARGYMRQPESLSPTLSRKPRPWEHGTSATADDLDRSERAWLVISMPQGLESCITQREVPFGRASVQSELCSTSSITVQARPLGIIDLVLINTQPILEPLDCDSNACTYTGFSPILGDVTCREGLGGNVRCTCRAHGSRAPCVAYFANRDDRDYSVTISTAHSKFRFSSQSSLTCNFGSTSTIKNITVQYRHLVTGDQRPMNVQHFENSSSRVNRCTCAELVRPLLMGGKFSAVL